MGLNASSAIAGLTGLLQKHASRPDRTTRYMRRVDEHLLTLEPGAKLAFLRLELEKWLVRYEVFQIEVFGGKELSTDATAWDYAETIGAISVKLACLERTATPAAA